VGYLKEPVLWAIPYTVFLLMILSRTAQESAFQAEALGDKGASKGALQFNDVNRAWYQALGLDPLVPRDAGELGAHYMADAIRFGGIAALNAAIVHPYVWTSWIWTSGYTRAMDWTAATARAQAERLGVAYWKSGVWAAYGAWALASVLGVFAAHKLFFRKKR